VPNGDFLRADILARHRVGAMDDYLVDFSHRSPLAHGVGYLDVQFVAQRIVGRHTGCCHVLSFPAAELETLKSEG
jgi:hypothetical protein